MKDFTKALETFEEISIPGKALKKPKKDFDYSRLVRNLEDVRPEMKRQFKEGKKRGETTHIPELDEHFKWKKGFLYGISGWPQHGKSEWTLYLACIKSKFSGWKWLVYSPESGSADEFYDQLAHTFVGRSTDPFYTNQMTESEYDDALEFIKFHFFLIDDDLLEENSMDASPDTLRQIAEYYKDNFQIDGFIKDNWNNCDHDDSIRDDKYLKTELKKEKRLAVKKDLCNVILMHPKEWSGPVPDSGLPCPMTHNLNGGAMWKNKLDIFGAIHRDNYHTSQTSPYASFWVQKVKQQRLIGTPGKIETMFNPKENRYYINGRTHMVKDGQQYTDEYDVNKLPDSEFESEEAPF
jgi:hypothetical protein